MVDNYLNIVQMEVEKLKFGIIDKTLLTSSKFLFQYDMYILISL